MIKPRWFFKLGFWPALAGVLATALTLFVEIADPFGLATLAREHGFDGLYALFPRSCCDGKVVVIDIDDASLLQLGSWPVPRARIASLVDRLANAQPSAIAFDIFFANEDKHSARTLAAELSAFPEGGPIAQLAANLPDSDAQFAESLRNVSSVLGALAAPSRNAPPVNAITIDGPVDRRLTVSVDGISGPYPPLADAALGVGILSLWGEDGGLVRKVPLICTDGKTHAPGLALEATRVAVGAAFLEADFPQRRIVYGAHSIPIETGGFMRIHWSDPAQWAKRTISAIDFLNGHVDAHRLTGAIIIVGSSAPEVGALRPTPAQPLTPSVQIAAEAVEQLLTGRAPLRPPWIFFVELAATLILGLLATWLATIVDAPAVVAAVLGIVVLWLMAAVGLFRLNDMLLDPFWPSAAVIVSGNAAAASAFARTQRLKTQISRRFEQYLAPDVVRAIVERPDRLKLDGEMREVTALFTDIEDFTRLTQLPPRQLIDLLDAYFDGVCRIVTEHNGMIDLIVGDAVHVFFNMPLDLADHTDAAIACALAIAKFSDDYRRTPLAAATKFGRTRIGIETGLAIVGDVGGPRRFNYTAHGAVSNAAARLEMANKDFGTTICIGPGAAAKAKRFRLRLLGTQQLRGFPAPVDLFTVIEPGE